MSSISDIEELIITQIETDLPDIPTVRQYDGDFDTESLTDLTGLFPCILILFSGSGFSRKDLTGDRRITVFVGSQSLRKDDYSPEEGVYELFDDVRASLDHKELTSAAAGTIILELATEALVYHDAYLSIGAQSYSYYSRQNISDEEITLGGLSLPTDLIWQEQEFIQADISAKSEISIGGDPLYFSQKIAAGKNITLVSTENAGVSGWFTRDQTESLLTKSQVLGAIYQLILGGTSYYVRFRHEDPPVVSVTPVLTQPEPESSGWKYYGVIKLIEA